MGGLRQLRLLLKAGASVSHTRTVPWTGPLSRQGLSAPAAGCGVCRACDEWESAVQHPHLALWWEKEHKRSQDGAHTVTPSLSACRSREGQDLPPSQHTRAPTTQPRAPRPQTKPRNRQPAQTRTDGNPRGRPDGPPARPNKQTRDVGVSRDMGSLAAGNPSGSRLECMYVRSKSTPFRNVYNGLPGGLWAGTCTCNPSGTQ